MNWNVERKHRTFYQLQWELGDYVSFPAVDGTNNTLRILVLVHLIEKKETFFT